MNLICIGNIDEREKIGIHEEKYHQLKYPYW